MTSLQTITAEARLDKAGQRVLCGNKQNGRYWCGGQLGWIVESPHALPEPYPENARRARDLGFDVTTVASTTTGEVVERPAVVRRYLRLPDGWAWQGGYWGRGRHAERAVQRNRVRGERRMLSRRPGPLEAPDRVTTRWRTLRWCDPGYLTPDHYPVAAKCPDCELVQMLIAGAQHLRLHVHGDISDLPWEPGCDIPLAGRGRYLLNMVEVEAFARMLMSAKPEGQALPPDCARLVALAYHVQARVTVEARWWQQLQTWARTASPVDCRRCLDEATADGPGLYPSFAREFLLRLALAARAVVGAERVSLLALRDRALLGQAADGRYTLHKLVRQYAAEQAATQPMEAAEAEARHARCRYVDNLALDAALHREILVYSHTPHCALNGRTSHEMWTARCATPSPAG